MQCRFVGLLPLFLLSLTLGGVPTVRSAPQPIDFLLGDEELQAVVKPIPAETTTAVPTTEELQHQKKIGEDEQHEEQATVDPVEDEQQTEDPYEDDYTTEEDEQEHEDPVTEEPEVDEEPTNAPVADVPKDSPVKNVTEKDNPTTPSPPSPPPSTTSLPVASTAIPPTSADGSEEDGSGSSEEQLTVNPIVAQEPEDHDSSELAQDVNDFIQDLAIEARAQSKEGAKEVNPPAQTSRIPVEPYPREVVPTMPGSTGYIPKSLASSEESNEQEQVKVNPIVEQVTSGPVLTEEQYRTLVDKLNWYDQRRFTGYNQQWPTNSFPQRSAGLQRDERQRHYQSHGSDSFHGHAGFHRGVWH